MNGFPSERNGDENLRKAERKYVVDTCIFNKLVDGLLRPRDLPVDGSFIATHVQVDEINKTPDTERRARLLLKFTKMTRELVPTETFVWDVSRWDEAKWSNGEICQKLKTALDARQKRRNNIQDALIAEVAIINGFTLLTSDGPLAEVAKAHGADVRYFPV